MTSTTNVAAVGQPWSTTLKAWIGIQELPKHLAGILPFLLGTTLVYWQAGSVDWTIFWWAFLAQFLLTDGTYITNEYFDYDNDRQNLSRIGGEDRVSVTTTGGTRVLVKGLMPRRHALIAGIACFALAVPVGLVLQFRYHTGPLTIPLGLLGIFIGWFYTAPPIRASYRGWGELFIAIGQGLIVFGAYYVQLGASWLPIIVSLPWFISLPALKILREFPDFEADLATDKRGLTQRFGRERMAIVYSILITIAIASFVPIYPIVKSWTFVLVLLPAWMFAGSAAIMIRGQWRDPVRLERAAVLGFSAMLLVNVVLAFAFLLPAIAT